MCRLIPSRKLTVTRCSHLDGEMTPGTAVDPVEKDENATETADSGGRTGSRHMHAMTASHPKAQAYVCRGQLEGAEAAVMQKLGGA